ncbi:hypothetical protein PIB30_106162, partial [Stylosanthes scabra]|nr:hypothetical protein [Stylosanthes scabra]
MDLLSAMPKAILDDILARLPHKDAAKTIVLSKTWRHTWYSFPIVSVCNKYFFTHDIRASSSGISGKLDIFINYVTKRLLRLRDQGLAIKELKLNLIHILHLRLVSHHLDQWIQMACESGVEVLELTLSVEVDIRYDLPICVIEAKSLTKLELDYGIRIGQEFLRHSMKLSSVKMLSLRYVLFTHEGVMEHFISLCPHTEHLTIRHLYVHNHLRTELPPEIFHVKSLFLHGLQKLKEVDVRGIQELHIDSPNLENLSYRPLDSYAPFKLNFDSCATLRSLALFDLKTTYIVDKWFVELFSKHPFLKSLIIYQCSVSERINISSTRSTRSSLMLQICYHYADYDYPNLPELHVSSIPPSIKHLDVRVYSRTNNEALYGTLLNYLLSSCFPKTISFGCIGRCAFIE